jgi:hypothetical protein
MAPPPGGFLLNPNIEYRNSKQIRMTKILNVQNWIMTVSVLSATAVLNIVILNLGFVSDFVFRISNLSKEVFDK